MKPHIYTLSVLCFLSLTTAAFAAENVKVGVVGAANQEVKGLAGSLAIGNDIHFKETITTNKTGTAQLLFLDKSALTVGNNASVTIDKFIYDPENSKGEMVLNGAKGAFRFIGGALSKQKQVKIKTPVSTIGIRGGIVMVDINPNTGATNATFVYGQEMTMENLNGQVQKVTNPGFAISVSDGFSAPTVPVKVDLDVLRPSIQSMESKTGQTGGVKVAPNTQQIQDKLTPVINGEGENEKTPQGQGNNKPMNTPQPSNQNEQKDGQQVGKQPAPQPFGRQDTNPNNNRGQQPVGNFEQGVRDQHNNGTMPGTGFAGNGYQQNGGTFPGYNNGLTQVTDNVRDTQKGQGCGTGANYNCVPGGNIGGGGTPGTGSGTPGTGSGTPGTGTNTGGNTGGNTDGNTGIFVAGNPNLSYLDQYGFPHPLTQQFVRSRNIGGAPVCSSCQFVDWGVWAYDATSAGLNPNNLNTTNVDNNVNIPLRVAGEVTKDLGALGLTGNVTYSGITVGRVFDSAHQFIDYNDGSFTAIIDMNNRKLANFSATIPLEHSNSTLTFGVSGAIPLQTVGDALFATTVTGTNTLGPTPFTGNVQGALFGPQAENIGGVYKLQTNSGYTPAESVEGVFVGGR